MESIQFIEITPITVVVLFVVGFVGGMVSGFIGSGGAFVLTPAMMSLGAPAAVAVASNMAHKFPKALVGALKRYRYGQVDIKLGIVMGVFAEAGVLTGKTVMVDVREAFGSAGTNLYVSAVFIVVLAIVGGFVLRDAIREHKGVVAESSPSGPNRIARWVHSLNIPGTMIHLNSIDTKVSVLVIAPLGFATGLLAATIAVGGFIGVPAMIYVLGVPALTASATELVVAFVMGMGGSFFYALDGFVDIRLSMLILAGSLFGVQIGAIGTTYVKDYVVKFVMASIMLLVLLSRFFYLPGYFSQLALIAPVDESTVKVLNLVGEGILALALLFGAVMILQALFKGIREHRKAVAEAAPAVAEVPAAAVAEARPSPQLSPVGRFNRFLVASDMSDFGTAAMREAVAMAVKCKAEIHVMSLVPTDVQHEGLGESVLKQEVETASTHLQKLEKLAVTAGLECHTHLIHGTVPDESIVALADELKVDVIVMGRRGRRGLARLMLGHATANVIGGARCNVLVVPRKARFTARHMILATDGSRSAQLAAITAGRLARLCDMKITVISVRKPTFGPERRAEADQAVQRVLEHMKEKELRADGVVMDGEPGDLIVELAREKNADLIITGSHGRTGLERVLLGSTTERILNETTCSVLVVKGV